MTELESIAKRFDLTVSELAKIMDVKETQVCQWQTGSGQPSTRKLCKLFSFIGQQYLVKDTSSEEFMIGRDEQLAFESEYKSSPLMPELNQEDSEKVRTKLNQVASVTNMLLLATDEKDLHHGSLSLMSDTLFEMKQILKT